MAQEQVIATDKESLRKAFIPAPEAPGQWPQWREQLKQWALEERQRLGHPLYDRQAQAWASRAYAQGFLMLWDHELIDHTTGRWKVDQVCDRAEREFGGYDVVVLWCNYPLSGVDPRHQIAYYDDLPGGREGLRDAVRRFHERGVRVLVDHKPWVLGLPEGHGSVEDAYVELVRECELDGVYLDCSAGPEESFRQALWEKAGRDKVFCPEAPAKLEPFGHSISSWLQMTDDTEAPGIYRNRWLDRNHLTYECRRYFYDPMREVQRQWMNGGGIVIWENVFGYYANYSPRFKSWLRMVLPAQRRFADFFINGEWVPHVGGACHNRVYVSQWTFEGRHLWTIVNRRSHAVEKGLVEVPAQEGCRYVDVISGQQLRILEEKEGRVKLGGRIEREGVMGILPVPEVDADLADFLQDQRDRMVRADFTAEPWPDEHRKTDLPHVLRQVEPTQVVEGVPEGMVKVPDYAGWLVTRYRMRECGYIAGAVDELHIYDAFERTCPYSRKVDVRDVAIDALPVTNAQFAEFLQASGYSPASDRKFLRHWDNGKPPAGKENHPVVYVSLADARAYARWAGKRLPREEEWQRAAQGEEGRTWPWGSEFGGDRCNSASDGTTEVDAFPHGRTSTGIWDMSGNVWEMTESERTDGHTRYQILKGGCWYHVANSHWLFDTGAQPADWGAKQILLCDGWDRCATIGFRCVVDLT